MRWLDRGPEREELLVSISTDGKVKAWTIAKGLEHSTLITLKRTSKRLTSAGGSSSAAAGVAAGAAAAAVGLPAGSGAKAAATVAALRHGVAGGDRDALISRNTGGMSFDFSSTDSRIYLAGGCQRAELEHAGRVHACVPASRLLQFPECGDAAAQQKAAINAVDLQSQKPYACLLGLEGWHHISIMCVGSSVGCLVLTPAPQAQ